MDNLAFILPTIIASGLACWVLFQRRQVQAGREEAQRAVQEKEAVIALMDNIGERMTRKIDLDETLEVIGQYVVGATRAESGAIFLLDEGDQSLRARVIVGKFPPLFEDKDLDESTREYPARKIKARRFKPGEGIIGTVAQLDRPVLITDAEADPRIPAAASRFFPVHSMVFCPLRVRGRSLGVIAIVNKHGHAIFDSRDKILLQGLADQAAISVDLVKLYDVLAEQQRLDQELALAQDFQRMLLPHALPQLQAYEFSAVNRTARVVGGDFYDFFPVDQDHLGIVIGDVSGKGVPASLIMAMVRSIIRAEARDTFSPKEVLRRVNEGVKADTKESVFVTITYGILDISNDRFRFARAGHEPVLLRHAGPEAQVDAYQPEGMAVGLVPSDIFNLIEEMELQLAPGDMVLLYTDGVVESLNPSADEYGRNRLIDLLRKADTPSAEGLIRQLEEDIRKFAKGTPQHDDITLVALSMKPSTASPEQPATDETPRTIARTALTQAV